MDRDHLSQLIATELRHMPGPVEGRQYTVRIVHHLAQPAFVVFGVINLSSRFLEFLWWSACLFLLRYRALFPAFEHQLEEGELTPLVNYDDRIYAAYENFVYSRKSIRNDEYLEPRAPVNLDENELPQVNSIFLRATAWVIYHETAHIDLGHDESNIENEHAADEYATNCIRNSLIEPDGGLTSQLSIVTAIFSIMSIEHLEHGIFQEVTHPLVYRRLLNRLDQFDPDENSDLYLFASTMLRGELISLGVDFDDQQPAESVRASFEYHIIKLESYIEANT